MLKKYNKARQATDDNKVRLMRIACWIPKAIDTYSEYVILIAFPRHQWLRESTSVLLYTYNAFIIKLRIFSFSRVTVF